MDRMTPDKNNNKMWFLQFARGLACLLIVYVHWLTFLLAPASLDTTIFQSALPAYQAPMAVFGYAGAVGKIVPVDFREVYFGLALFFIISGFIIPVSLEKGSRANYVIRRIARILPTAFACTVITALVILFGRLLEGNTVAPFSVSSVLANAMLIRDVVGHPYIDTAIWTLEIEVHFYVICFVLSFFSGQKKAWVVLVMALAFLFVSIAYTYCNGPYEVYRRYLNVIATNGTFLVPMFIGMALYNFNAGNWSVVKTALVVVALLVMNNLTLQYHVGGTSSVIYFNHLFATLVFVVLLLLGDKVPYFSFMDKLAEVSYPLYLLHGTCGYVVFYIVYKFLHETAIALLLSFTVITALTFLVHRTIELPSTPAGKRIAKSFDKADFFGRLKRRSA
ncbi:acyltransferase family protein [Pseudomonas izuensis]|uniref:Acyltransferase family protein n=1 Tax=Pseudomonas izuensis TaxID=2684212 RepID=A0ABM7RL77_9PSED|nr:acyltransferase [Pseudomonas izuensis]BCX66630.1 acyltransferase family protein [Pseudomonas izuensis]